MAAPPPRSTLAGAVIDAACLLRTALGLAIVFDLSHERLALPIRPGGPETI
jgi:hypothetical protein